MCINNLRKLGSGSFARPKLQQNEELKTCFVEIYKTFTGTVQLRRYMLLFNYAFIWQAIMVRDKVTLLDSQFQFVF